MKILLGSNAENYLRGMIAEGPELFRALADCSFQSTFTVMNHELSAEAIEHPEYGAKLSQRPHIMHCCKFLVEKLCAKETSVCFISCLTFHPSIIPPDQVKGRWMSSCDRFYGFAVHSASFEELAALYWENRDDATTVGVITSIPLELHSQLLRTGAEISSELEALIVEGVSCIFCSAWDGEALIFADLEN